MCLVPDTAGVAHAAGGYDHFGNRVLVDGNRFLLSNGQLQAREHERVNAGPDFLLHLFIHKVRIALQEDAGGLDGERAVHIHREVAVARDQSLLLDLTKEVEDLLGAPHRK